MLFGVLFCKKFYACVTTYGVFPFSRPLICILSFFTLSLHAFFTSFIYVYLYKKKRIHREFMYGCCYCCLLAAAHFMIVIIFIILPSCLYKYVYQNIIFHIHSSAVVLNIPEHENFSFFSSQRYSFSLKFSHHKNYLLMLIFHIFMP